MSMSTREHRDDGEAPCLAPGRRRAANTEGAPRSRSARRNDACATGRPIRRTEPDDPTTPFDAAGELAGFASWFADWWIRRGRDLTAVHSQGGQDE
jgi:hypothetical protein